MAISREDITSMSGTATETVVRMFSDFKDELLIEMKGRTITALESSRPKALGLCKKYPDLLSSYTSRLAVHQDVSLFFVWLEYVIDNQLV